MKELDPRDLAAREGPARRSRWPWFLVAGCLLVTLIGIFWPQPKADPSARSTAADNPDLSAESSRTSNSGSTRRSHLGSNTGPAPTAEEIVAGKVMQFGRSRREIVRAIGRRSKKDVPTEVEKFFDAIEAGRWEDIKARWDAMSKRSGQYEGSTHARELDDFWPAVLDAYGVAEQAHLWPAQKLLDYGNAILDSLRPGMVYVGGTDPGRWIPELLNETSSGEQHIIVTQNAFADGRYLDFANTLYSDRMATLTSEDSQRAFQEYLTDAQKRLAHDQQFPDEPKQIRPGEDVRPVDGKVQVSGQVAVMAINERMLQMLMDKNPELTFAIEQSFPFQSTYASATPLGPIMELRVQDEQNALTAERAAQSVDYWRTTAQQLLADPETPDGSDPRKAYSKLVSEQAALLLDRKYTAEAEQAFQIAIQICPSSPEAVFRYVNLLVGQNRFDDAVVTANNALKAEPDNGQLRDLLDRLKQSRDQSNQPKQAQKN